MKSSRNNRITGLRVLHIADTGSGANWMYDILRGLRDRGYDVAALISSEEGDLAPKLEREGIPVYFQNLNISSGLDLAGAGRAVLTLAKMLKRLRFDIVHYHLFSSVIIGRLAAWLADAPLRFSMLTGPFYLEASAPRELEFRTQWIDTQLIASCEYSCQLYREMGITKERITRIFYGADESLFSPEAADGKNIRDELGISQTAPVVGMVAYFYPPLPHGIWTPPHLQGKAIKGHEVMIHAAQIILRENPQVRFALVGSGWGANGERYKREMQKLASQLGLEDAVIFAGFRKDIANVLASFDITVQCSLSENLGGTIEALLMARPLVATAVGGMVDSVRHEETGLLVPPGNARKLAEAISYLLNHPRKARTLGENGRRLMLREFTLEKTVDDIDRLYQTSCASLVREKRNWPGATPSSVYYRPWRSLLRLFPLAIRWFLASLATIRWISPSSIKWKGILKSLRSALPELLPLVIAIAATDPFLSPVGQLILISVVGIAFFVFRTIFSGPTIQLIRLLNKRALDIVVAAFLLAVTLPVWSFAYLALRLDSPGPLLVSERMVGRFRQEFRMFAFRVPRLDSYRLERGATGSKIRSFCVGRIFYALSKTGLTMLPMLLNLMKSDLSLVGPRPVTPNEAEHYSLCEDRRFDVKPGIISLAWINGSSPLSKSQEARQDAWYADRWSIWLDLYILLKRIGRSCLRRASRNT